MVSLLRVTLFPIRSPDCDRVILGFHDHEICFTISLGSLGLVQLCFTLPAIDVKRGHIPSAFTYNEAGGGGVVLSINELVDH